MRLDFFLLAEAAFGAEGKLYIHGGGLTTITPPRVPWTHPQLAVVIGFVLDEADRERGHELNVRLIDPAGDMVLPDLEASVAETELTQHVDEDQRTVMHVSLTVAGIPMRLAGVYTFEMLLDGERIATRPLRLVAPDPDAEGPVGIQRSERDTA
jgi:hypothetical protein